MKIFSKRFISKKKIVILIVLALIIILACSFMPAIFSSGSPKYEYTVVIDAGHGGRDGGCVGVNGSLEKDLNLEYAKTLKEFLETKDIRVVLTRTNDDGLYDKNASNKKLSEMKNRAKIIMNYQPDLMISIHMNSFALKSASGAKVFYKQDSEKSKSAGEKIQQSINYYCNDRNYAANIGDYYVLNCTNYTSVLIECGYLSNPEEEQKLMTKDYREKLMHSVFCGIVTYLGYNYY